MTVILSLSEIPALVWVLIVCAALIACCKFLAKLRERIGPRALKVAGVCLIVFSVLLILSLTIFDRSPGIYRSSLVPFSSFFSGVRVGSIYMAGDLMLNFCMYGSGMLINMLMFVPLGLSLIIALPNTVSYYGRIAFAVLAGYFLSVGIETTQFLFMLGNVESDDVIANTIGAFIGALWPALMYKFSLGGIYKDINPERFSTDQ